MMTREAYGQWWIDNTDPDGEVDHLPEPVATLAAHVLALQERIDKLPAVDEVVDLTRSPWINQCACAYDDPRARCMSHDGPRR